MGKEKKKEYGTKFFDDNRRFRWGILFTVAVLSSIILFPNLVITRHRYNLGDVAQRDIKSPRDFFIEDQAATETNRQPIFKSAPKPRIMHPMAVRLKCRIQLTKRQDLSLLKNESTLKKSSEFGSTRELTRPSKKCNFLKKYLILSTAYCKKY